MLHAQSKASKRKSLTFSHLFVLSVIPSIVMFSLKILTIFLTFYIRQWSEWGLVYKYFVSICSFAMFSIFIAFEGKKKQRTVALSTLRKIYFSILWWLLIWIGYCFALWRKMCFDVSLDWSEASLSSKPIKNIQPRAICIQSNWLIELKLPSDRAR